MEKSAKKSGPNHNKCSPFSEICGAIHIHTRFSDGEVDFPELIDSAKEVGLDFIIVTDHMTLEGKDKHLEGFYDNLLVLIGYEHNDINDKNHYLAIGTDIVAKEQDSPQRYIDSIKSAGGIGFLAHPAEERRYFKKYPSYPWTEWNVTGYNGIEVWNHMSEWVEGLKSWGSFIRIFYPRRFLKGIPPVLLKKWDEVNRTGFVSGIGGIDAHTFNFGKGIFRFQIFPIKVELKGIRTHLYIPGKLTEYEFEKAREACIKALQFGAGYISNYRRGDARETKIFLSFADGTVVPPGYSEKELSLPANLSVSVPLEAQIRLIRNGVQISEKVGVSQNFEITECGLYRIEVFRMKKAWIYSNPFPIGSYPHY